MNDVLNRIKELREERNWSVYRLAKLSGLPQSTIATWYQKNLYPPIDKLELICDAFGISLSDFFNNGYINDLSEEQLMMIQKWTLLEKNQRQAIINIIDLLLIKEE